MARAGAVVMATGGCAFFSRLLGSRTNTGDGYLMAAEAGAALSGMEFTAQYVIAPAFSTMGRSMSYAFATYYGADGKALDLPVDDGHRALAKHLLRGPVYCDFSRMPQDIRDRLPFISPNVMLPFVRSGIDPFVDRFPVTLLAEGTIRGMGGIKIADDDCQTAVPGLYAAGDAASRELVAGATSGGGSINSAWTLSSGTWSGRAAALRARREGIRSQSAAQSLGQAGLRPQLGRRSIDLERVIATAREEATHYDKNLFRTATKLHDSLAVLQSLWDETRGSLQGVRESTLRARETAALVATARWSVTAAFHRQESRGQHQREDAATPRPEFARRQTLEGIDRIASDFV